MRLVVKDPGAREHAGALSAATMRSGGFACAVALLGSLIGAAPLRASGIEHVIDDADVETPGFCHLESYVTRNRTGQGLVVASPACTRKDLPDVELGGFVSHGWAAHGSVTTIGLAPKWKLREAKDGPGIALKGTIGFGLDSGQIESASLLAPVTFELSKRLSLNVDAGWQWLRGTGHSAFAGAQLEFAVTATCELMAELFGRADGRLGAQAGIRWTVAKGKVDLDLAYGRYVDGATPHALTAGAALRF